MATDRTEGDGVWISQTEGLKEYLPGQLAVSFGFKSAWARAQKIESIQVAWNWWPDFTPTTVYNPEVVGGRESIEPDAFSDYGYYTWVYHTFDIPANAAYVRVWARIKWKYYEVKEGNDTIKVYYGGDPKKDGYDRWFWNESLDFNCATDTWPRVPPEPEYELKNGSIRVMFPKIRPISLDESEGGLGYANALKVELVDYGGTPRQIKYIQVWWGSLGSNDSTGLTYPYKTSASCNFPIDTEEEWFIRATSIRYGTGLAPVNYAATQWPPRDPNNNPKYTDWVPHGEKGIVTEPKKIFIKELRAESSTSVYLSWDASKSADYYKIVYAERWQELSNLASNAVQSVTTESSKPPNVTNFRITGLETGKTYYFAVQGVNDAGESVVTASIEGNHSSDPATKSNWTAITLGKRPSAPTTFSSTTTAKIGQKVYLFWKHNSEDGSIQEAAQLELDINGKKEILEFETPEPDFDKWGDEDRHPTDFYEIDTTDYPNGATIKWRVRTAGILYYDDPDLADSFFSSWSIQRVVDVFAPPSLSISGDSVVKRFPYNIVLKGGPSTQKILSYHLSIVSKSKYTDFDPTGTASYIGSGQEIFSFNYDPNSNKSIENDDYKWNHNTRELTVKLNPGNINLANSQVYTATGSVTMSTGLSTDMSYDFTVAWDETMNGDIAGSVYINRDDLTAQISASYLNENGTIDNDVYLNFYRRTYDGNYLLLESEVINSDQVVAIDPHPPLDYANYRVSAIKRSTGSVMYRDLSSAYVGEIYAVIQWDESWPEYYSNYSGPGYVVQPEWEGTMLKLPWNIDISDKWNPQTTSVEYIGREHPVGYYGTQVGSTSTWKMDVVKADREIIAKLRRLATYKGNVYVREPYGSGYWAMVKVSFSQNHTNLVVPVTLDITRVEGGV